ncbi:NADH-ubiquinone/plastoquinone complex I subunit [Leptospira yanagawae serovar Saopaulo str. Sao Paulo = ATCC 700523]|uniref:NADH-ubiquinone/plastoquinone complex I subunit n=1 Tax=Leptospira yanagawae serovar Saopaulo str. Sao Paulo = ATCC 700523 TaxID=1249483 RepID=A0A5E8H766_9LEPT|nr:proton-conducting transporter membrane subunit [Leptospira yanagawae]EOQ87135.1 NADH-ubiquinone/plastoquinone complex I subunit [Leptospira yanagawae serovar Saopaulo str. Sao Paulo = ATCC 700523]
MFEENKISILQSILVGISALLPLIFLVIVNDDIMSVDFPILVGLSIQAFIGFASFMLVLSYEPKEKNKVTLGYAIFWSALGVCYLAGKSLLLPIALEITSFSTILIYSGTDFGKKQIESLGSLLLASGISALFLSAWVMLPDGDSIGILLLLFGLLIKSGFSGFHIWLPKVNEGGPSHALGAFAGVLEIFPLLLFYRYVLPNQMDPIVYQILFPLAALGIFFGGITSFFHKNPKISLAYSSIESLNFLWLCLIITGMFQFSGDIELMNLSNSFRILFFLSLFHHSFSKTFQLFSIGMVSRLVPFDSSDSLKGIGRLLGMSPILLGAGTFSYAVIPGTLGFVSEATYFYLNVRILDLPIGRSVFLLPSMIFIFFGIVLGGFTHLKLYFTMFLSLPSNKMSVLPIDNERKKWLYISLFSLSIMIFAFPLVLPFFIQLPMLKPFADTSLEKWFINLSFVSFLSLAVITLFIIFDKLSYRKQMSLKRKGWDCGGGYDGHELSIPSTVFSEPLKNSLGRYFINKNGDSKVDHYILLLVTSFFKFGTRFISSTNQTKDEDISRYLAISSIFLIFIFSLLILGDF